MNVNAHGSRLFGAGLLPMTPCLESDGHCPSGAFEACPHPTRTRTRRAVFVYDVDARVRVELGHCRARARGHDGAPGDDCVTGSAKRCLCECAPLLARASLPPLAARALLLSPPLARSSPPASAPAPLVRCRRRACTRACVCLCLCLCAATCSERTGSGRRGVEC